MKIKDVVREIRSGKNLEMYLPKYFNEYMTVQDSYANLAMTFHYYTLKDMLMDVDMSTVDGFEEVYNTVESVIQLAFGQELVPSVVIELVEKLDAVRNTVINRMKVLTTYTDAFQIYEYVLNRMEGKFIGGVNEVNVEELTNKVMSYIFSDNDNTVVNSKIQEVVGQLPVRITKAKFVDLISDGFSIYKGSDQSAVESFLYLIRTSATLDRPEGYEETFPELFKLKGMFETVDYKTMDEKQFNELKGILEEAVNILENNASLYYTIQEVINDLYTILLTAPYAFLPGTIDIFDKDVEICKATILGLNNCDLNDHEIPEVLTKNLTVLEGKQEKLVELRDGMDGLLTEVGEKYSDTLSSLVLDKIYRSLVMAQQLQSGSIFVEFDQEMSNEVADEKHMKKTEEALLEEFKELFGKQPQILNRAVMATVLSKLPVFFNNREQIQEYVSTSLEGCKDIYEKSACANILNEIIDACM